MALLDELYPNLKELEITSSNQGLKRRTWLNLEKTPNKENKNNIKVFKREICFEDLRSNPLQLFYYLYKLAKIENNNFKTPRIRLKDIMIFLNISKDSARTALRFLLKNALIKRIDFQAGKMGWSKYQLSSKIWNELEKSLSKQGFISNSLEKNREVDKDAWELIDISPLEEINFTQQYLLQLKNKTTPEIVQESINHFAFALKHNNKVKNYTNPIVTFMAVLKRGEAWLEPNYISPQEIAQKRVIQAKKEELERKVKLEEEFYKLALQEWQSNLNKIEKETIIKNHQGSITPASVKLNLFFKEEIWPNLKNNYLSSLSQD
ncbi:hypothetical protein [Legionella sainthelensi]|uniref:hypothetical protein n=1 Tax=Legionella sainthelensi TaxID=28087 RepID=UPI000EF33A72|nr:hypothetical protein [Legionella sainthelensi]AYK03142.1 hypothetical protein CAB17_20580 [Legionella sainthelensi]